MRKHVVFCIFFSILSSISATYVFQEQFSWKVLDYAFLSEQHREYALATTQFIPENSLPVGIEIWNDKLFVTVPRWRQGEYNTNNVYIK